MCGLAGLLDGAGLVADPEAIAAEMAETLAHRGPDGSGRWSTPKARLAFGFRRLAVQDLSNLGDQPMRSSSGRFVAMLNGEIYDFTRLRDELRAEGVAFRGRSDTEVMLAMFERHGVRASLDRLNGMFAIAVWDERDRTLWLVRDRLGKKPMHVGLAGSAPPPDDPFEPWALQDRTLCFASELRGFRPCPGMRFDLDESAVAAYFQCGVVPAPRTIHRSIRKLPPGGLMRIDLRRERPVAEFERWWSVADAARRGREGPFEGDEREALDEIERLTVDAASLRLLADVPVGLLLSGGVDSTAVAGACRAAGEVPKTFSIAFGESGYDESASARRAAETLGSEHREIAFGPEQALAWLDRLGDVHDEPFADSSQLPMLEICRAARQEVTVALTGDGGDEVFGGYERYRAVPALWSAISRIPAPLRTTAKTVLGSLPIAAVDRALGPVLAALPARFATARPGERARQVASLLDAPNAWAIYERLAAPGPGEDDLLPSDWKSPPTAFEADGPGDTPDSDLVERMIAHDLVAYLPDDILVKADRTSMASGLELRSPLLDHRLVELLLSMPTRFKVDGSTTKPLLRRLAAERFDLAPPTQPKMGFAVPMTRWLDGPLSATIRDRLDPARLAGGPIRPDGVARLRNDLARGVPKSADRLWWVLAFEAWRSRWGC